MPCTSEPPPRHDVPGQMTFLPPADCPPHPAGPRDGRGQPWWDVPPAVDETPEALRKRDERRETE